MKRFIAAAAVAVALALGSADTASAQIVYGYNVPTGGGFSRGGAAFAPGSYQTYNSYYSPFTGVVQSQAYGTNVFGQTYGRSAVYNPWTGLGYNTGFYQPNRYLWPYGGYNWGFVRPW